MRQLSPHGCEKVFYAFVLAELFPRHLYCCFYLLTHSVLLPVLLSLSPRVNALHFSSALIVRMGCGFECVFKMWLIEEPVFLSQHISPVNVIILPPSTKGPLKLKTFTVCLLWHPVMGCPAYLSRSWSSRSLIEGEKTAFQESH